MALFVFVIAVIALVIFVSRTASARNYPPSPKQYEPHKDISEERQQIPRARAHTLLPPSDLLSVPDKVIKDDIEITDEFKKVSLLQYKNQVVFVSGGAGTGKTTLIKWFMKTHRADVVLAFTGVAAQNCGGQTLHSFFKFPFGLITPQTPLKEIRYESNLQLIRNMKAMIIDEISMVRADLLDAVDRSLRHYRKNSAPFGGVKVLMVGDLHQLPPIDKDSRFAFDPSCEGHLYDSVYFFSSNVFKSLPDSKYFELTKCFRQNEDEIEFLRHLNNLREANDLFEACDYFNANCLIDDASTLDDCVNLTTTNNAKDAIDSAKLRELPGAERLFRGDARGSFIRISEKLGNLPAPLDLILKQGAFVMLLRNDPDKRYVNGSTGIVKTFYRDSIEVKLSETSQCVTVGREEWKDIRFTWNPATRQIEQEIAGKYTQFPLCLSWACTIHKAQGATIPRVCVDFGNGAFEKGQAYVAMSRTRSIAGIKLKTEITPSDIKPNPIVDSFYNSIRQASPTSEASLTPTPALITDQAENNTCG